MEPIQEPIQPQMSSHTMNKKKFLLFAVVIFLALIAAVVLILSYNAKKRELTPAETLDQLGKYSQPVTSTPAERKAELDALIKQSAPVKTTVDQREQGLRQLRGESEQ